MQFYYCNESQNIYIHITSNDQLTNAFNQSMVALNPKPSDDDIHMINVKKVGNFVTISIGKENHPMIDIHYISMIAIETNKGCQLKHLKTNDVPLADFLIEDDEELISIYAYCTTHFLYRRKLRQ